MKHPQLIGPPKIGGVTNPACKDGFCVLQSVHISSGFTIIEGKHPLCWWLMANSRVVRRSLVLRQDWSRLQYLYLLCRTLFRGLHWSELSAGRR